jgi:hypothetical protein
MPYIEQARRRELDSGRDGPRNADELNYMITQMLINYLGDHPHYAQYNDVLGVLTAAQLELYRRLVAPYEVDRIAGNGDVFPPSTA